MGTPQEGTSKPMIRGLPNPVTWVLLPPLVTRGVRPPARDRSSAHSMAVLAYLPPGVTAQPSSHRGEPILVRRVRLGSCNGLTESSPSRVMTTSAPLFTLAPDHGPCDPRTGSSRSTSAKELGRNGRRDGPGPWPSRTHDFANLIRTLSRVCLVASNNSQEAQGWGGVRGQWFKRSYG